MLSNRKIEDLIIIDNLIYSFCNDLGNGIPIKPYIKGKEDYELEFIADQLKSMKSFLNCSEFLNEKFRLRNFYNYL